MKIHHLFLLLGFMVNVTAAPESTSESDSASGEAKVGKVQTVRVVPIGARRTAVFVRSKKAYKIRIDGPEGEVIEENIAAGVPIEVAGKENEYVPYQLYVPNRDLETGEKQRKFALALNSLSRPTPIRPRDSIHFYKRQAIEKDDGPTEYRLSSYGQAPAGIEATHVLVALVKNPKELEGWKAPYIKSFDTSPGKFPSSTCLVFNASPFPISITLVGREPLRIAALGHAYLRDLQADKYGAIPYRTTMKIGSKIEHLGDGALRSSGETRHYIFTFVDPRKGAKKRGDMFTFSEKTPVLPKPDGSS